MNINDLSTQLLFTTVPIFSNNRDGSYSTGTGFIFSIIENDTSSIPLLITNYHVLKNAATGFIELHIAENGQPTNKTVKVQFDETIIENNKLGELDLIAIPLAETLNDFSNRGVNLFYRTVDQRMIPQIERIEELAAIETITFIGYPSGLYDIKNKTPLIRQGITSTPIWNDYNGRSEFLIDAGVFPGSSGSPVFVYNQGSYPTKDGIAIGSRLFFVGVITETMLRTEVEGRKYLDLGVVINSHSMIDEINAFISRLKNK